jgi:hypothetical protein
MKSKSDFESKEAYREYKRSPEHAEYMNSPEVIMAQKAILLKLREYRQKREEQRDKHRNTQFGAAQTD